MYDTYVSVPVPVILYRFKKSGNSLLANICFLTCKKTFLMRLDKSWQRSIEWDILQFKYKLAEKLKNPLLTAANTQLTHS